MHAHAKVVWRNRCKTACSPENEKRRLLAKQNKEACETVTEAKAAQAIHHGSTSDANESQRESTVEARPHRRLAGPMVPTKISQKFTPAADQNIPIRARLIRPAQMVTMPRKTQKTISSAGSLGPEAEDTTDPTDKKRR